MTDDALPLDMAPPKRARQRAGAARSALERTLKAWAEVGHLTGQAAAAARRVLRDGADAVDAAHGALVAPRCQVCGAHVKDAYSGSPGGLAYANNLYAQLLRDAAPATEATDSDPYAGGSDADDFDALAAAWLSDAAPGDPAAGADL